MMWLAGDDPVKADSLEKDSLINYWALLNKKLNDHKRSEAQRKALEVNKRGRSNHRAHPRHQ